MPLEEVATCMLPYEIVLNSPGFSFDYGGSVLKVVYRHKEDWAKAEKNKDEKAPIRLVSFPRHELDEAIKLLKADCHISPTPNDLDGRPFVYATGIGGYQFKNKIEAELGVSVQILAESNCFADGVTYMVNHLPKGDLFHTISDAAKIGSIQLKEQNLQLQAKFLEAYKAGKPLTARQIDEENVERIIKDFKQELEASKGAIQLEEHEEQPYSEKMDIFPCMIAILGSAFWWFKLERDGSYAVLDMSSCGGRTFVGEGKTLTGAKDFSELVDLAEKGNCRNVDEHTGDFAKDTKSTDLSESAEDQQGNLYNEVFENDFLVFSFGKGARPDAGNFRKEDLAASVIQRTCIHTSHKLLLCAQVYDVKNIFLVGSLLNRELIRNEMYQQLHFQHCRMAVVSPDGRIKSLPNIGFLKGGSHFCALGAFLHLNKLKLEEH